MNLRKSTICAVCLAMTISCGGGGEEAFEPLPFPSVSIPSMYETGSPEALEYYAVHFWDDLTDTSRHYPCDSSLVSGVKRSAVEAEFANYALLVSRLGTQTASEAAVRTFRRISACEKTDTSSNVFETIVEFYGKYLYDPSSPMRDEDAYLPFVHLLASSDLFDSAARMAYRYDEGVCSLNRKGTPAADFSFIDNRGREFTLYGIKAEYTLLFFSNPGCTACKEIIDALSSSPEVSQMIAAKELAVANVYIDEELDEWMAYMPIYPKEWYNGYDPEGIIRDNSLYAVRAIPSLYLLDRDKKVLLKDAEPQIVFQYIDSLMR